MKKIAKRKRMKKMRFNMHKTYNIKLDKFKKLKMINSKVKQSYRYLKNINFKANPSVVTKAYLKESEIT